MSRLTPLHAPGMRKTLSGSSDERTPIAGPSRLSTFDLPPSSNATSNFTSHTVFGGGGGARDTVAAMFSGHRDDGGSGIDTDDASTPRLGLAQSLTRDTSSFDLPSPAPSKAPASERLRDVLARARNHSEPVTKMTARPGRGKAGMVVPASPGPEYDVSDLDARSMSVAAGPSFAQESLKDLFGRFTLDTPDKKGKGHVRRRSSLERVQGESPGVKLSARRVRRGRVSLSDDELHKSVEEPLTVRRSAAETYAMLGDRLDQSSAAGDSASAVPHSPAGSDMSLESDSVATFDLLHGSPPSSPDFRPIGLGLHNQSTPHRPDNASASLQMPHMLSQSQLLAVSQGFDSQLRKMIESDSDADHEPEPHQHQRNIDTPDVDPTHEHDQYEEGDSISEVAESLAFTGTPMPRTPAPAHTRRPISWTPGGTPSAGPSERTFQKSTIKKPALGGIHFPGSSNSPSHTPPLSPAPAALHDRERGWGRHQTTTPITARRTVSDASRHTPGFSPANSSASSAASGKGHSLTAAHLASHNSSLRPPGPLRRAKTGPGSIAGDSDAGSMRSIRSRTTSMLSESPSVARELERGWNQPNPRLRRISGGGTHLTPPGSPGAVGANKRYSFPGTGLGSGLGLGPAPGTPSRRRTSSQLSYASDLDRDADGYGEHELEMDLSLLSPANSGSANGSVNGRSLSRSSSRASLRSVRTEEEEVEHERERNWMSPHPTWNVKEEMKARSRAGSISESDAGSVAGLGNGSGLTPEGSPGPLSTGRARADSLKSNSGVGRGIPRATLRQAMSSPNVLGGKAGLGNSQSSPSPGLKRSFVFGGSATKIPTTPSRVKLKDSKDGDKVKAPGSGSKLPLPRRTPPARPISSVIPTLPRIDSDMDTSSPERGGLGGTARPSTPLLETARPSSRATGSRLPLPSFNSPSRLSPLTSPKKDKGKGVEVAALPPESPSKARHRRTTTELHEANGALRPGINDEYLRPVSPTPVRGKAEDTDGLHTSDEEIQSDAGATPTMPPLEVPQRSPPKPAVEAPRVTTPPAHPLSPPTSPGNRLLPSTTPNILTTPPRSSASLHLSRLEFNTPSPPKGGLPDLPDMPGSDDETLDFLHTPVKQPALRTQPTTSLAADLTNLKTPRPPGAWGTPAVTPAPAPATKAKGVADSPFEPDMPSTPPAGKVEAHEMSPSVSGESERSAESGLMTPASSLSRIPSGATAGNATVAQTPAPPGGWVHTPAGGSLRSANSQRGSLRVRFENATDSEAEGAAAKAGMTTLGLATPMIPGAMPKTPAHLVNADELESVSSSIAERDTFDESGTAPVTALPPLRGAAQTERKRPVIRVLDAYGNEQTESEPAARDVQAQVKKEEEEKSQIRIVDARGELVKDEVEDVTIKDEPSDSTASTDLSSSDEGPPMSREDALRFLKSGVKDLAGNMKEFSAPEPRATVSDRRFLELMHQSASSKQRQARLEQHLAIGAETIRNTERAARTGKRASSGRISWRQLAIPLLLGYILIFLYHRHNVQSEAELYFKTNYYDPFVPELHAELVKPSRHQLTLSSAPPTLSFATVRDSIRRSGWNAAVNEVRYNTTVLVSNWQRAAWERWGVPPSTAAAASWPPT